MNFKKKGIILTLAALLFSTVAPNAGAAKNESGAPKNYIIGLKKEASSDQFVARKGLKNKKAKKAKRSNTLALSMSPEELSKVSNDADVLYVEADSAVNIASVGALNKKDASVKKVNKKAETVPWGIHAIGAELAAEQKINGNGIKVAVMDTGIAKHSDLKIAGGVSFVPDHPSYLDDNGHGTHVSGTIAALDNRIGVVGAASKVSLYAVKVLDGTGEGSYSQVIQGIEWAIDNKMDIISMSFGGTEDSQALHEAIKAAADQGILVIAAAGNSGAGEETELYPARYSEAVSVAAVNDKYQRASFSSTGSQLDLAAPGTDILSTTSDGEYGVLSGTSMATPHVTGAAALLWSKNKNWSPEQVKQQLYDTATPLGNVHEYGRGLVNVAKALQLIDGPVEPIDSNPSQEPSVPDNADGDTFNVNALDLRLLELSDQLDALKRKAQAAGNIDLAKQLQNQYYSLHKQSAQLHGAAAPSAADSKPTTKTKAESASKALTIKNELKAKADEFKALEDSYKKAIADGTAALTLPGAGASGQTVTGAVYRSGDGQIVPAGQPVTVYVSWPQPRSKIFVTVTNIETKAIVASDTSYPTELTASYTWNTSASTVPGSYSIRLAYPEAPEQSDEFTILVNAPEPVSSDTETEALTAQSSSVTIQAVKTLTLNTAVDVNLAAGVTQVYSFTPSVTDKYRLMTSPYGGTGAASDTVLDLYSDANLTNMIDWNDDGANAPFSQIDVVLTGGVKVYLVLSGYGGGDVHARLLAKVFAPTIAVSGTVDVNSPQDEFVPYKFTASSSGFYRFFTTYYGGTSSGGLNDTMLNVYSDMDFLYLEDYNDDAYTGNTFSEVSLYMTAGTTYYMQVGSPYSNLRARLSVAAVSVPALSLTSSIDADYSTGVLKVYSFTPSSTGMYKFYTGAYGGTGADNDTRLELYDDARLTSMIAWNDDNGYFSTNFSEIAISLTAGVKVYLKVTGSYYGDPLRARLKVSAYPPTVSSGSYVDGDSRTGGSQIYKLTAPSSGGMYKVSTGYYGGTSSGGINDTMLEIFSDVDLNNLIDYNDNVGNSLFSELIVPVVGGQSVYLKVSEVNGNVVHARLSVATLSVTTLSLNTSVDVAPSTGSIKLFKFTPSSTGTYRFNTTYYGGNSNNPVSDTMLTVSTDQAFQNVLPYGENDDANGTYFSEANVYLTSGVTYYVKLINIDSTPLNTRIKVSSLLSAKGAMEKPTSGQTVNGTFEVSGWALDGLGVDRVELLVDGIVKATAVYGYNREDIYTANTTYNNHDAGWMAWFDSAVLTNGTHTLSARSVSYIDVKTTLTTRTITVSNTRNATILSDTIPTNMEAGKSYNVAITVRNDSTVTWEAGTGFSLGAVGDSDPFAAIRQQIPAGQAISPGQQYTFNFVMTAPTGAGSMGSKTTDWQMRQDNFGWFGAILTKTVTVVDINYPSASSISNPGLVAASSGSYEVFAYGVTDTGTGVANVEFVTWTEAGGQDDIVSHAGTNMGNGTWKAAVPINQHKNERGNYITHVYATNITGNRVFVGNATAKVYSDSGKDYSYDTSGRLMSINYPTGNAIRYLYDRNGNLLQRKWYDPTNNTTALSDFSQTQGYKNWSYAEWNGTSYIPLTWELKTGKWVNNTSKTEIKSQSQLPGTTDAVRKWVASVPGTITIAGNVAKGDVGGGDGVRVKIMKNGTQIWPAVGWREIAYDNAYGYNIDMMTSVAAGDAIYFVVNSNATSANDSTNWNPSITYH
ncbi:S8 family serine peptidase [Cohnella faecalis]|uniref:S8 family serine peptidase n=1 Tax=Cohnella faecalis TaxID=2315694 RepID=UPI001F221032|nr:S8 family serine peptidase [Cohnella faecalis]